jgi:hypothetical protein
MAQRQAQGFLGMSQVTLQKNKKLNKKITYLTTAPVGSWVVTREFNIISECTVFYIKASTSFKSFNSLRNSLTFCAV